MAGLTESLKYNSFTAGLYNLILNIRTTGVDGYVFVATTGRSGSESLSKIFQAADRAVCLHEPYPIMLTMPKDPSQREEYFETRFRQRKRINVKRSAAKYRYYVETNHQFVKNFIVPAVGEFGDKMRIVHLHRDPVKVATSFLSIDSIPGKTPTGIHYLLDPADESNRIRIVDLLNGDPAFSHDFLRCVWYWYEIETRTREYRTRFSNVPWFSLNTEQLNDEASLVAMFETLRIVYDPERLKTLVGSRENTKTALKKKKSRRIDGAQEMHDALLARMVERYGADFWRYPQDQGL
ncbi:MAG: hypothetical protein KKA42_17065 [candidate division Zixibacteria bacterium]|nr:hypothetical protein [candidate division Zixibacteria bacterium]